MYLLSYRSRVGLAAVAPAARLNRFRRPGSKFLLRIEPNLKPGLARLSASIDQLKGVKLLPDVQIFRDAVRFALENGEFFKPEEIARAKELAAEGQQRADDLHAGPRPLDDCHRSRGSRVCIEIDKSVQPYGLVIPASFHA